MQSNYPQLRAPGAMRVEAGRLGKTRGRPELGWRPPFDPHSPAPPWSLYLEPDRRDWWALWNRPIGTNSEGAHAGSPRLWALTDIFLMLLYLHKVGL